MNFATVRVYYTYPLDGRKFHKDYTVPENEPFAAAHAQKQWQRDHTIPHNMVAFSGTGVVEQEPNALFVQLPLGYCETKYPGYFWNANEQKLYSLKSGMLKEVKRSRWNGNRYIGPRDGYNVSHLGKRRHLRHDDLMQLVPMRSVIPTMPVPKRPGSRWS